MAKPQKTVAAKAATATKSKAKGETPDAVKAKGPTPEVTEGSTTVVPTLKPGALSLDVGPMYAKSFASAISEDRQATELAVSAEKTRGAALTKLTVGIVKAATADKSINLNLVFGSKQDKVALNNLLYSALGFKAFRLVGEPGRQKEKFTWVPAVAEYFGDPDDKSVPESIAKQKDAVRTNAAHMFTKCIHGAIHIMENKLDVKPDTESGTLRLTGPAVKAQYGVDSVVLNGRQDVKVLDKKGNETKVKLKEKPSFASIGARAAAAHGVTPKSGPGPAMPADPAKAVVEMATRFVAIIGKLAENKKAITSEVKAALESLSSALDKVL